MIKALLNYLIMTMQPILGGGGGGSDIAYVYLFSTYCKIVHMSSLVVPSAFLGLLILDTVL